MTVILAYAVNGPGDAAAVEAIGECHRRGESLIAVPADRDTTLDLASVRQQLERLDASAATLEIAVESADLHDPSDAVVQVAQREAASLIVVGLHRRSRVGKIILGSTAQRILLDATCPVLAVRPPD